MTFESNEEMKIGESIFGDQMFWVGYKKGDGAWKMVDGRPNAYANTMWQSGYPNTAGDCAAVSANKMVSVNCGESLPYLCSFVLPKGANIV